MSASSGVPRIASRLAYHVHAPPPTAPAESVSPVHVVMMHGLLGCYRNFHSIGSMLSGTAHNPSVDARGSTRRLYQAVGFDWRNHGDSGHDANMSLDGLADDLKDFLSGYATLVRARESIGASPASVSRRPVPLVLVAHSMGGMGLMHYLWREHAKCHQATKGEANAGIAPMARNQAFFNEKYNLVGGVIIDVTPTARPRSFYDVTMKAVEFLPRIPLAELNSRTACEAWVMKNGPQDVFNAQNAWAVKFYMSNVDTAEKPIKWKIGLDHIIHNLNGLSWCNGGISVPPRGCSIEDAMAVETVAASRKERLVITAGNNSGRTEANSHESIPQLGDIPMMFNLGEVSPYNTLAGVNSLSRYFERPIVDVMPGADHFLFMNRRDDFLRSLYGFLRDVEVRIGR